MHLSVREELVEVLEGVVQHLATEIPAEARRAEILRCPVRYRLHSTHYRTTGADDRRKTAKVEKRKWQVRARRSAKKSTFLSDKICVLLVFGGVAIQRYF